MASFSMYNHIDAVDGKIKRINTPHGTRKEVRYKIEPTSRKLMNRAEMRQDGRILAPIDVSDDDIITVPDTESDEDHDNGGLDRANLNSSTLNTFSIKGDDLTNIYNSITSRSSRLRPSPSNPKYFERAVLAKLISDRRGSQHVTEPHSRNNSKADCISTFERINGKRKHLKGGNRQASIHNLCESDNEGLNMDAQHNFDQPEVPERHELLTEHKMTDGKAQTKAQWKPAAFESGSESDEDDLFVSARPERKKFSSMEPLTKPSVEQPGMPSYNEVFGSHKRARTEEKTSPREHLATSSQQPAKEPTPSAHTALDQTIKAHSSQSQLPKTPMTQENQDHDHMEVTARKSTDVLDKGEDSGLSLILPTTPEPSTAVADGPEATKVKTENEAHQMTDSPAKRSKKRKHTALSSDVRAQILETQRNVKRRHDKLQDQVNSDDDFYRTLQLDDTSGHPSNRLTTENLEHQTQIQALTEKVDEATTEIQKLTEEAQDANKKAKTAKKDIKRLREENEELKADKAALEKEARATDKQSRDQAQKLANLKAQCKELDDDSRSKDRKIRKLEDEMEKAKITYEHRIEGLEEDLLTAQTEAKSAANHSARRQSILSKSHDESVHKLNDEIKLFADKLAQVKDDLTKSEALRAALAKELERGNFHQAGPSDAPGDDLATVKNETEGPIIKPAMREDYKRLNERAMGVVTKGWRYMNQAEHGAFSVALQNLADATVIEVVDD